MTDTSHFDDLPFVTQNRIRAQLRETNNLAFGYTAILVVGTRPPLSDPINHGSGVILRLNDEFFFLTADHVVRKWRERHENDRSILMHLMAPKGSTQFAADERLVFADEEADIATLRLTSDEAHSTKSYIYEPTSWPPPAPNVNEMVYVAGFPREGRIPLNPRHLEFRAFTLCTPVTSVADRNFKCAFERKDWISESDIPIEATPKDLEGISGGPVFAMRGLAPVFMGSVVEYQPSLDILVVARWSHISADMFRPS